MLQRVQYADDIEPLVRFIEETPPSEIVDATMEKLRAGVPIKTMMTASALAVTRSADLPPGHHGGPLHPLAGMYAILKLVDRLEGEDKFVPVLQHVALSNKHINDPATGPYQLLEFEPLDAEGGAMTAEEDLAQDGSGDVSHARGIEATKEAFLKSVGRGESHKADHYFQWLWKNVPEIEAFDLLMSVAIPKNTLDDHYFLFPGYLWRGLELIGHEHLPVLMRPAVRYAARFPAQRVVPEVDALIEEHQLLNRILRQRTGDDETATIGALGEAIGRVDAYRRNSQAAGAGLGGWAVDGRRRRGLVDRRRPPVPALAHRQPDGCASAHQRQPAPLLAQARRPEQEEQAADPTAVAYRSGGEVHAVPHAAGAAAEPGSGRRLAASVAGRSAGCDHPEHLHAAADRLVQGQQSRPDARRAGSPAHGEPGAAIRAVGLRCRRCS